MTNERRLNHHILAAKISIMLVGWVDNAINIVMLITLYAVFISVKLDNDGLKNQNILVRSIFSLLHMPIGQSCSVFCTRLFVNKEFAVIKFLCQGQINSWLLCNFLVHQDPSIPYIFLYIYLNHGRRISSKQTHPKCFSSYKYYVDPLQSTGALFSVFSFCWFYECLFYLIVPFKVS